MTNDDHTTPQPNEGLLQEAERLIWAMLDEQLTDADLVQLETLLKEHDQVRQRYLDCVQIHGDLHQHFAGTPDVQTPPQSKSPILGSLGDLRPDSGTLPPVSE